VIQDPIEFAVVLVPKADRQISLVVVVASSQEMAERAVRCCSFCRRPYMHWDHKLHEEALVDLV